MVSSLSFAGVMTLGPDTDSVAQREALTAEVERRLKMLIVQSERERLTGDELAEYQALALEVQRLDAARAEALAKLARRRGKSARTVKAEIGSKEGPTDGTGRDPAAAQAAQSTLSSLLPSLRGRIQLYRSMNNGKLPELGNGNASTVNTGAVDGTGTTNLTINTTGVDTASSSGVRSQESGVSLRRKRRGETVSD